MSPAKVLPALLALCLVDSLAAADNPLKASLKALDTVKVQVSISQSLLNIGMTEDRVRTDVELQLRKAGLKVDPALEQPYLWVEAVGVQGPGTDNWACLISVSLYENVKVERNGEEIVAGVWGPAEYVLYLPENVVDEVSSTFTNKIDDFLNDWLRVNPR